MAMRVFVHVFTAIQIRVRRRRGAERGAGQFVAATQMCSRPDRDGKQTGTTHLRMEI